ncbi:unnamed protein product [Brassicogethes aeneus]|uniref:Uncharacterized protein n=1 Tax=Brassicogethes aeneus TaxID=1431903 RepID=A0A9P0FJS7_BRAAE|nr:unnamed protein product [Brassicogethes aeneus]
MSINVHVSGNPVKIHKGKMVTSQDSYQCKKDFEKRRLLRLQQVRQQSKDIAQDVRNKVKKEKQKQIGEIEKEGKEKLKNWKNKKLMELQSQYKEALDEIGMGHEEAEKVKIDEENYRIEKMKNDVKAKEREQYAMLECLDEKVETEVQKNKVKEIKKAVREKENLRSQEVITKTKRTPHKTISPKKSKPLANINISVPDNSQCSNSENEENFDRLSLISEEPSEIEIESSCSCADSPTDFANNQENCTAPKRPLDSIREAGSSEVATGSSKALEIREKAVQTSKQKLDSLRKDTRISDRIKRREVLVTEPDYCEEAAEINPNTVLKSNTKLRDAIYSRPHTNKVCDCGDATLYTHCNCCCSRPIVIEKCSCKCKSKDAAESPKKRSAGIIPEKPTIRLKEKFGSQTATSLDSNKVSYYEHKNKFDGKTQSGSVVEKISCSDLEVENLPSDKEYYDKMKQRDQEAISRAKKALEKKKIQRDYKEIMQKLPLLQKQEKLAKLNTDRPEYHMNEERRQELERKKQNQLDNAYTNLFPNLQPKIVTLPSRSDPETQRSGRDSPDAKNIATWDVDYKQPKLFTANEVQDIVSAFSEPTHQDRKSKFKELLKNLKTQKKQLLAEVKKMPKDDSVVKMLRELNEFDESTSDERPGKPRRRTKSRGDKKSQRDELSTVSEGSEYDRPKSADLERRRTPTKKRVKSRPTVLIKQNMSTQTTPKSTKEQEVLVQDTSVQKSSIKTDTKSSGDEPRTKKVKTTLCEKKHTECDCLENDDGKFEIVIQINDEKPVVTVKERGKFTEATISKPPSKTDDKTEKTSLKTDKSSEVPKSKDRSKISSNKSRSWKEQFSRNSTTSTSYFSPPDFSPGTTASFYNPYKRCAAKNTSNETTEELRPQNPQLFNLVAKLLDMSKSSIDNLPATSSTITTPNQSVVEIESNIPHNPLHDVLKFIAEHLNDQKQQQQSQDETTLNMSCDVAICPGSRVPQDVGKKEDYAKQYALITDNASKKIEHLAAKIQQLREEKSKIIEKSVEVDGKDNSTAYLDYKLQSSNGTDSSLSVSDEELYKRFLGVDVDLANRLRKHPSAEKIADNEDDALMNRLQKLIKEPAAPPEDKAVNFVPLLADIPKLPKFGSTEEAPVENGRRKPPPSKGLSVARRFNEEISTIPHELSAIPEAERESHVSSKADISRHSVKSRNTSAEEIVVQDEFKKCKTLLTSDSSEDVETLEQMLKSIGMEWAIPTLQKTKKALELTSSSTEDSGKLHSTNDTTLLKYLKQQLMSKISSSTLLGNSTPHSLLGDFSDVSVIQSVSLVKDKNTHRTSTPVQSASKSRESLKEAFYGESDLSTVRHSSQTSFHSTRSK